MNVSDVFDLSDFKFAKLVDLLGFQAKLKDFFNNVPSGYTKVTSLPNVVIDGELYIGKNVIVKPFTVIEGRVLLDDGSSLGPHAYLRGDVVVGKGSKLGRCEVKHSVIMDGVNIHHHSYIGDSIVGNRVNIAAGFITANLRFDKKNVNIKGVGISPTYKFGALIGDDVKTMINSGLMPGAVIEKGEIVGAVRRTGERAQRS